MKKELQTLVFPPFQKEQVYLYAEASGDHNPIHLDPEVAQRQGFQAPVVHGMLTMATLVEAAFRHFSASEWKISRIKTRFKNPVFWNESLEVKAQYDLPQPHLIHLFLQACVEHKIVAECWIDLEKLSSTPSASPEG